MARRAASADRDVGGEETSPHGAADFLPAARSLAAVRAAAAHCRGCALFRPATQTVFDRVAVYVTNVVKHFKWEQRESAARGAAFDRFVADLEVAAGPPPA